jgi:Uma2 family endonuclease
MSTALKRISPQEYLIRERQASLKSEFFQGEVFAMTGGSPNHSLIAANFVREAGNGLKNKPCAVFSSDLRVRVKSTGLYTYPDATIVCGELEFDDEQRDTVVNPTVIIEVLSDSTEKYDRGEKSNHYRQIESLKELILISQDRPNIEQFTRQPNGDWLFHEEKNLSSDFEMKSLGISVAIFELYRNVRFEPTEDDAKDSVAR